MLKWFSFSGILTEFKRIRWPKKEELFNSTLIVLGFCIAFGVFFVISDALAAMFLGLLGIGR